jgi:hypothetical protein
MARSVS